MRKLLSADIFGHRTRFMKLTKTRNKIVARNGDEGERDQFFYRNLLLLICVNLSLCGLSISSVM